MDFNILVNTLNQHLDITSIMDYCPNGVQVSRQGVEVTCVAIAVTASLEAIHEAARRGAQVLIVHHGYFWKGEAAPLVGMKYERIRALMQHNIALLGYHLPLDLHPQCGNNVELARILQLKFGGVVKPEGANSLPLLAWGEMPTALSLDAFAAHCTKALGRTPLVLSGGDHPIRRVAFCTGAAQQFLPDAKALGADVYISGEVSERTYYEARELGIHYLGCGHHATERFGIQALGCFIAEQFQVSVEWIESENPV
jgi:dinuclear metal center YbgI/SA1388 family protein